jgi:hypothetical protein
MRVPQGNDRTKASIKTITFIRAAGRKAIIYADMYEKAKFNLRSILPAT